VTYVVSGRELPRLEQPVRAEGAPVLVADPNYRLRIPVLGGTMGNVPVRRRSNVGSSTPDQKTVTGSPSLAREAGQRGIGFARLPGTRLEAERLRRHFAEEIVLGDAATEAEVRRRVHRPKVWHGSTHVFVLDDPELLLTRDRSGKVIGAHRWALLDNPLQRSGLALAGAQTAAEERPLPPEAGNGILTAYDITRMDLRGTFMTLAACKGARGFTRIGRGVMGLRSALVQAGVRTALLTLWPVDDFATAIFMERFYAHLLDENAAPDVALRQAQEYLRTVTVGQLQQTWFTEETLALLDEIANDAAREDLPQIHYWQAFVEENRRSRDREERLYASPRYWGAFVIQGSLQPLA